MVFGLWRLVFDVRSLKDDLALNFNQLIESTAKTKGQSPAIRKAPRQAARDFKVFEVVSGSMSPFPSCLAGYFTWPQVALTHHVFHRCL